MNAPDETTAVQAACEKLRAEYERSGPLSVSQRRVALRALALAINTHRVALTQTISEDFRGRSAAETLAAELFCVHRAAKLARRHVKEWAQPEPVELSVLFRPGRGRVEYQPLGVIGIISPWNYPVLLALSPMIGALAAGNRVLLKPSELTPKTSALLSKIIPAALGSDVVAVVTGGPEVGAAVARLPLDHLLFTGSAAVGRQVMAAAAERLVPVTLELGGKSPVLLHERYPLARAARQILLGKLYNAGQTCTAPDYVLCPADRVAPLTQALAAAAAQLYPTLRDNPDYTAIISDRRRQRLMGLVEEAVSLGAVATTLGPVGEDFSGSPRLAPVVLTGVPEEAAVLREEIFGPILPIVPYKSLDEAVAYINARPRPLALYCFDRSRRRVRDVLSRTVSGGVTVNGTLLHTAQEELPLGGVGESGMGRYHGFAGFETFSSQRAIYEPGRLSLVPVLQRPSMGWLLRRLLRLLML